MLSGTAVALITPFKPDLTIDFDALARLIERDIEGGIDYIVVMGTTAETPTLSSDERRNLGDFVADRVAGRVPLVLGCGGNDTASVARELAGIDPNRYIAALSVTPFYNKPTQRGLYAHYRSLAEVSSVPLILYNVPGRTGVNLAAETTLKLAADCPNIRGVKEASGNLSQIDTILSGRPDGFSVISGDDSITLPLMAMGADGVISVVANAFPDIFSRMVSLAANGDIDGARVMHRALRPLFGPLVSDGNPAGIKSVLHRIGLISNMLRPPLVTVSQATADTIDRCVTELLGKLPQKA